MTDDDRLSELLSDSVSDIEPDNRLAEIRTATGQAAAHTRRTRLLAIGGAVVGTAAVVTAVALVSQSGNDTASPGPATTSSSSPTQDPTNPSTVIGSPEPPVLITPGQSPTGGPPATTAVAVYYVGADPHGRPVLYREFHQGLADPATAPLQALRAVETPPFDPDYSTAWKPGTFAGATYAAGVISVDLADSSVHDRPADMSQATAEASIQQIIYTIQATFQTRAPVQFTLNGNPVDQVLGVPTSEPLSQGKVTKTLSLMSISSPNEGDKVSGQLTVTGANNGFEASLVVYLERDGKQYALKPGMASASMGERLFPWTVTLDLTKVPPGKYTLVAENDDPTGNGQPSNDTRTVFVK
jgi:hypothetical protein